MINDILQMKCSAEILCILMMELQKGFYVSSREGKSIFCFLTEDCGLSDEYVHGKVKTVMIDGGPVDDIFNTSIKEGGVCALSGAMPGLVGAMMRMGSPYAAMRETITVKADEIIESGKSIYAGLKLFNIILNDLGFIFLTRGVLIEKKRVVELFDKYENEIFSNCREISINGLQVEKDKLFGDIEECAGKMITIKIEIVDED